MSFGFSAGDFIAVGNLIADIISCLDDATGSASEYQEVLRELRALDVGLKALSNLQHPSSSQDAVNLDAIKCSALACQVPLQNFLNKTKKYNTFLGFDAKSGTTLAAAGRKVDWRLRMQKEAEKLRMCLSLHVGTINMQLSNKGLTSVFEMSQEVCDMHSELTAMLQHNAQAVSTILEGVNTQRSLLQRGIWLLSGMANVITKWVPSKIEEIITAVTALCITTQKIYELVLEIQVTSNASICPTVSVIKQSVTFKDSAGNVATIPPAWGVDGIKFVVSNMSATKQGYNGPVWYWDVYPMLKPGQVFLLCSADINSRGWTSFMSSQLSSAAPDDLWIMQAPFIGFKVQKLGCEYHLMTYLDVRSFEEKHVTSTIVPHHRGPLSRGKLEATIMSLYESAPVLYLQALQSSVLRAMGAI